MNAPEFRVIVTVHNAGPHTIWGKLAARLGREPTNAEAAAEVRRILSDRPAVSGEYARSILSVIPQSNVRSNDK